MTPRNGESGSASGSVGTAFLQHRRLTLEVLGGLQSPLADPRRIGALGVVAIPGGKLAQLPRIFQSDNWHRRHSRSGLRQSLPQISFGPPLFANSLRLSISYPRRPAAGSRAEHTVGQAAGAGLCPAGENTAEALLLSPKEPIGSSAISQPSPPGFNPPTVSQAGHNRVKRKSLAPDCAEWGCAPARNATGVVIYVSSSATTPERPSPILR